MKRNGARIWLTVYWAFCMAMTPAMASAYIDPSTTTFLTQALIGLGVAVVAGFSIYWRKARKKINKAIGKDETARKDESDDIDSLPGDNAG